MGKFNKVNSTGVQSPIKTVGKIINHDARVAFARDTQSELYLFAVSNFVGQDTFYENAKASDDRFVILSQKAAVADRAWFGYFVSWLRNEAFMRSAAVVAAVEGAKALHAAESFVGAENASWPRHIVSAAQARADEPGEVLGYYEAKYGKNFPAWLKKGVADGAKRLYNEYSLLKYDTVSHGYRFSDVIQLTHPKPDNEIQEQLFKYAMNSRYNNTEFVGRENHLPMIETRKAIMEMPVRSRKALIGKGGTEVQSLFKNAGMTWEALSGWLQGPMDAAAWEAVIPSMGYMALLRNLRNFQNAGIRAKVLKEVLGKLADFEQVAKSKQFPFRFLAAYQANKDNLQISAALESALQASLANVPSLNGNSLILVDRSGSMFQTGGGVQGLDRADTAAIFGTALAMQAEKADLVQYGSAWYGQDSSSKVVSFRKGNSILPMLSKFENLGGTDTTGAIKRHLTPKHDRVILITDEQYNGYGVDPGSIVPAKIPMYTWNLGGYQAAHSESGSKKRHTFGGLTDKAFVQIPMIEAGQNAVWPWEAKK